MNSDTHSRAAFAILIAFALAGCGGGGGGGSSGFSDTASGIDSTVSSGGANIDSTDSGASDESFDLPRIHIAADNTPTEGSVVQSSGSGITKVDLDAARIDTEEPPDGTFSITRGDDDDGFKVQLADVTHDVRPLQDIADDPRDDHQALPADYDFDHPEDGKHFAHVQLGKSDRTAFASFATDFASQSGGDDYLAFGIWAYSPDGTDAGAEIGAFADGKEYVPDYDLPVAVSANYIGKTIGAYSKSDGERGALLGDVDLFVRFYEPSVEEGLGEISAQITGSVNTIYLARDDDLANAELQRSRVTDENGIADWVNHKIQLHSQLINDSGFFIGDTSHCIPDCDRLRQDGKWGGQFFGEPQEFDVGDDKIVVPSRIAGTWGVLTPDFDAIGAYGAWVDVDYPGGPVRPVESPTP